MPDISDILRQATPREAVVAVCLAGDLVGEVDRLQQELAAVGDDWRQQSIGDVHPAIALVKGIEDLREQMRDATVEFRLRALGHRAFSNLIAEHPAPKDAEAAEGFDPGTFLPALLAACCTDPVMTAEQATQLLDVLNDGQARELFAAVLAVNREPSPLPFS